MIRFHAALTFPALYAIWIASGNYIGALIAAIAWLVMLVSLRKITTAIIEKTAS